MRSPSTPSSRRLSKIGSPTVLGSPMRVHRREGLEAWQYCRHGLLQEVYLVAWLADEVLDDWETREILEIGDCESLMDGLVWPEDREAPAQSAS